VNREYDALADDFVELGLLPTGANRYAHLHCTISPACPAIVSSPTTTHLLAFTIFHPPGKGQLVFEQPAARTPNSLVLAEFRDEVVPALTNVFSKALSAGVSNVSFSDLSADLGRTMYEFKFRIPPYYTLLVRTLSVLEVSKIVPLGSRPWQ